MVTEMIGNRYLVVKQIGEGGMATVFLAIDSILKREVAIKVLKADLAQDEINLDRFQREAIALTSTSHPNIVEVFDVGTDGDKNYIVMEYVHGKTLKQLIKQRGVIPVDEAVNIMKQLVSATANAHNNGIIHRDIKSQNVLVKDDGTVKLSDFGIAYFGDSAQQLTQTETVVGSVHYLAPELANGSTASYQSDIYSLGIVFYEMLTGDVPFHGETAVEIALKHIHNDVPTVRSINPTIPQSVENIVIRSTARNKNLRYASADKMYNDLVTCLDLSRNEETKLILNVEKPIASRSNGIKTTKHSNQVSIMSVGLVVALSVILFLVVFTLAGGFKKEIPQVFVPVVTNYELNQAEELINTAGLKVENVEYVATDDVEKGIVVSVSPSVGSKVDANSSVVLTVSLGRNFYVGDYIGRQISEVYTELKAQDFEIYVTNVEDGTHNYGTIIEQDVLDGTVFAPGSQRVIHFDVAVYVTFLIPANIISMDINAAKSVLEGLGAVVAFQKLNIEENIGADGNYIKPLSTVISTAPAVNTYYVQETDNVITIYYY